MKIFRTTTAAWLKFGNSHANWFDPDKRDEQIFISNWFSVVKFNQLAVPLFEKAGWHIIDGFQSTIGSPDHTERTPGGALVHFDHEVPEAHNHQLLAIIFAELCPEQLSICSQYPLIGEVTTERNNGALVSKNRHHRNVSVN